MKAKIIIFFLLLFLIGGTAFYFGWMQFKVDEHSYGVIFTKTNGYEESVLTPGEFVWKWQALIPTNLTLHVFELTPRTKVLSKNGTLPSGEIYGSVIEREPDFSYKLRLQLDYRIVPEKLPSLVKNRGLKPDGLKDFYNRLEEEFSQTVIQVIETDIDQFDSSSTDRFPTSSFQNDIANQLSQNHDFVDILNVSILEMNLPDIRLYLSARDYYLSILETKRQTEAAILEKERAWVVSEESKLEVLKEYGQVFTDYPGLIQFLSLHNREDLQALIPEIDLLKKEPAEAGANE